MTVKPRLDDSIAQAPVRLAAVGGQPRSNQIQTGELLSALVGLEVEARSCTELAALKFMIANATRRLTSYDFAVILEFQNFSNEWKISTASSVSKVDRHAPLPRAIEDWLNNPQQPLRSTIEKFQSFDITSGEQRLDCAPEFDARYAIWMPLKTSAGVTAGLLAIRKLPWAREFDFIVAPLSDAYGHAWRALEQKSQHNKRQRLFGFNRRAMMSAALIAGAATGFIPVTMSVLAPAEVVASNPDVVSSPIDGIIEDILVPPGQPVLKGQPILRFVDTKFRNDLEVARKAKSVAEAKYFKTLQSAVSTQKDMQDLTVAKAELEVAEADLAYAQELASRTKVLAPKDGLVIYSSKSDWLGKPVGTGERILEIADTEKTELRIDVHVSDAIAVKEGGSVAMFLDGDPLRPVQATLQRISYRPQAGVDRQLIFRLVASFDDKQPRRIGLRGTARVNGDQVSLGYYLFRRPISVFRQKFGL